MFVHFLTWWSIRIVNNNASSHHVTAQTDTPLLLLGMHYSKWQPSPSCLFWKWWRPWGSDRSRLGLAAFTNHHDLPDTKVTNMQFNRSSSSGEGLHANRRWTATLVRGRTLRRLIHGPHIRRQSTHYGVKLNVVMLTSDVHQTCSSETSSNWSVSNQRILSQQ